jgi:cation diffusion facilitator CzcD-associated flavoprotein CzcO
MEHVRFGVNYKSAKWNAETMRWELEMMDGVWLSPDNAEANTLNAKSFKVEARVLVSGVGGFSKPIIPAIKGMPSGTGLRSYPTEETVDGNFAGIIVHSARYPRQGLDLSGKSVLVIGNGCSGSQIVSEISKDPSIKVFAAARSAQWFMPQ